MKSPFPDKPVLRPEEMNAAFADAYNSGELRRLLALYEPGSIHVHPGGALETGLDSFRASLKELLQLGGTMTSTNIYCIPFENMALLRAHFTLHSTGPDGEPLLLQGHTSEIVRQQPEGHWLYLVDHPFGSEPLENLPTIR